MTAIVPASLEAGSPSIARSERLVDLDLLRGLALVVMLLDHVRSFWAPLPLRAAGLDWMATRWITHFVAPTFVLLAGAGVYLYRSRLRDRSQVSRHLLKRGLVLILLQFTVIHWGWNLTYLNGPPKGHETHVEDSTGLKSPATASPKQPVQFEGNVIWAIGASFIVLAGLVYLPTWAVGAIGLSIIALHNLADGISVNSATVAGKIWIVLLKHEGFALSDHVYYYNLYPLLPWLGIMAAGYAFGATQTWPLQRRRRITLTLGLALIAAFILLRSIDVYGEPRHWRPSATAEIAASSWSPHEFARSAAAFVDCSKYPPSLLFLFMSMGPVFVLYPALLRLPKMLQSLLLTFGRVPFFLYVIHLPFIGATAAIYYGCVYGLDRWCGGSRVALSPEVIPPLWVIYAIWILTALALYPAGLWYARVKAQRKHSWLKYL